MAKRAKPKQDAPAPLPSTVSVKLKCALMTDKGNKRAGDLWTCDREEAKRMIEQGLAVPVEQATREKRG